MNNIFAMKCERIKRIATEAHEQARMFNGFRYHQPSMSYLDLMKAAQEMRACADQIDTLACKVAPAEHLQAAE